MLTTRMDYPGDSVTSRLGPLCPFSSHQCGCPGLLESCPVYAGFYQFLQPHLLFPTLCGLGLTVPACAKGALYPLLTWWKVHGGDQGVEGAEEVPTLLKGRLWRGKRDRVTEPFRGPGPSQRALLLSPLSPEGSTVKRQRFSSKWRSSSLWEKGCHGQGKGDEDPNPLPHLSPTRGCPCAGGSQQAVLGVPVAGRPAVDPAVAATSAPEAAGDVVSERWGPWVRYGKEVWP